MLTKLEGDGERDKEIIKRLPTKIKKYFRELPLNESQKLERENNIKERKEHYLKKGYREDEIEVTDICVLSFDENRCKIVKVVEIANQHTEYREEIGWSSFYYLDSDNTKKENELGEELKQIVEEVFEEEQENKEKYSEEDEED